MTDEEYERAVISWLAPRGYLITKVDVVDVEVVETPSRFEEFWTAYPISKGKEAARKAFERLENLGLAQEILDGLARHEFTSDLKYVPHASTWLNGKRWEEKAPKFKKPQVGNRDRSALDAFLSEDS